MAPPADASSEEGPLPSPQSNNRRSIVQGTFVNRLRRKRPASQHQNRPEKFARLFPPPPEIENDDEYDMSAHHHGHHHHHTLHHHHTQQSHHLPPAAHHHHSVGSGLQHHHHHGGSSSNGVMRGGSEMGVRSVASSSGKFSSASSVSGNSMASVSSKSPSIASLCNLGNTCFLNSVLYTLRFTPGFLHNLHHMIADLNLTKASNKKKAVNGSLSNGHLSEPSCSSSGDMMPDSEMSLDIIERLHDLFKTLSCADESSNGGGSGSGSSASSREPIPPSSFLTAVGKLNPMFEGNQQQDAHELLVMILNILEDIKIPASPVHSSTDANSDSVDFSTSVPALPPPVPEKKGKRRTRGSTAAAASANHSNNGHLVNGISKDVGASLPSRIEAPTLKTNQQQRWLPNFVKDNFEGKQVSFPLKLWK